MPPATTGTRPRAATEEMAASASAAHRAASMPSPGSTTSSRWCGTAARSAELSATADEAVAAWEAAAEVARRDPGAVVVAAGAVARLGFGQRALALCDRAFERDLGEAALRRTVSEFWNGAPLYAESAKRISAIAKGEVRGAALAWAPLVMNVRILAINQGIPATNTVRRIELLQNEKSFSAATANELKEAYHILTKHRILLQIKVIKGIQNDSYYLNPYQLSTDEREQIRHALLKIEELQKIIHTNFSIM